MSLWLRWRRVKTLLVILIKQHGNDGGFVFALGQCPGKRQKAVAAFGLQRAAIAQSSLKQRGEPFSDDCFHIRVGRRRPFLQLNPKLLADASQIHGLDSADQRDSHARSARASCAPGTVDVAFGIFRGFVLDDVGQLRYIESTRRNIGRHQKSKAALAHTLQHTFTILLRKIGAQFISVVSESLEHQRYITDPVLCVAKDDSGSRILDLDQSHKTTVFVHTRHVVENVLSVGDMNMIRAERDELRFLNKLTHAANDRIRERC